jgi:3-phosphoshikimate 1-carboxyvinyltransferase
LRCNDTAKEYNIPIPLIKAVITTESAGQVNAKSNAGAKGLMQLMDGTAKDLGINISQIAQNIFAVNKSEYDGFEFDITDCPDLAAPLVVLAFNANTPSKIIGINRLVNKESNRRDVLVKVFSMLGGKIRIVDDCFVLQPSKLTGGFADSHNDHRIAMAIAIASKICKNPITLTGAECVNKSFPNFWKYFD